MPSIEVSSEELAKELGIDLNIIREKHKLIFKIKDLRKKRGWSQVELAKKMKLTQGRIAQIESGIGTSRVSFDVLLNLLTIMGYNFQIRMKKSA